MNDSIILLEKRIEVLEQNHNHFLASTRDNQYSSMQSPLILEYVKKLNEISNENLEKKIMYQMEIINSIDESLNTIKNKFFLYTQRGELSVIEEEEVQQIKRRGVKTQEEVRTAQNKLKRIENQVLRINKSLEQKIAEKAEQVERKVTILKEQINKVREKLDKQVEQMKEVNENMRKKVVQLEREANEIVEKKDVFISLFEQEKNRKLQKQKLEDLVYIGEKFYQCFKVHENKIFYLHGHQQNKKLFSTQVTLKARIPHNKIYRFEMKIVESKECCIAVGVADSRQREERSPKQCNSVVYWGYNGKLSYGYDGKWKYKMEGSGFKLGQSVIVEVQLAKGQIKWFVGSEERASISTIALQEKQTEFWPLILFVHEGDCIQWLLP